MIKHHLHYTEFYITNVCNLACDHCNRFNNYAFTGHEAWADYANEYAKWAETLNLIDIGILGGEPMLNPDFLSWVRGPATLWPNSYVSIITNGTQLDRWPTLYDELVKLGGRVSISVSEHAGTRFIETRQRLLNFLDEPTNNYDIYDDFRWRVEYAKLRQPNWPDCATAQHFYKLPESVQATCALNPKDFYQRKNNDPNRWQDKNGIRIQLSLSVNFYASAVKYDPVQHSLNLHHSDPKDAMQVCSFKKCHHFIQGKLYKCGPVGILPEFIKQFPVDITEEERTLLNSYVAAEHTWPTEKLEKFIKGLRDAEPIDQCRFCPGSKDIDGGPPDPYKKKIKIKAIR